MNLVTTKKAADRLGVTTRRIRAMIDAGIIPATKIGRDWMVDPEDIEAVRNTPRPPGRKRKG